MYGSELRPLSLGEILDRTFSLYRRKFLLLAGISALPSAVVLIFSLAETLLMPNPLRGGAAAQSPVAAIVWVFVTLITYLLSSLGFSVSLGALVFATADLYLNRPTGIAACLRRAFSNFWRIVGIAWLTSLAVGVGFVLLIIPGIYLACRLIITMASGVVEGRGPGDSINRSLALTSESAGRAFVVGLLYAVIYYSLFIALAFCIGIVPAIMGLKQDTVYLTSIGLQVGSFLISAVCAPILALSTTIFYFDLRVRKEGFDLQIMIDPSSEQATPFDRGLSLRP